MDALLRTPSSSAQELELQQKEHVHVLHQNYKSSSNSSGSSEHHHPATASSTQKTNSSCSNPADDDDDECACQAAAVADEVQRLNLPVQLQKRTVMSNASNGSGARGYNHAAHDKEEVEEVEGDDESQEMNEIQKEHEQELHNNEAKGEGEEKTGNSNNITNQRLLGPILTQLVHHGGRLIAQVRKLAGTFVNHPTTQWIIVACIAVNALMMGIATYDFVKLDESVQHAFDVTDAVFLGIFTTELGLQFVDRGPLKLLTDAWLVFDLIIVVASWSFSGLQIIRAFRIFRALRLITRIKVMQNLVVGTCFVWRVALLAVDEYCLVVSEDDSLYFGEAFCDRRFCILIHCYSEHWVFVCDMSV